MKISNYGDQQPQTESEALGQSHGSASVAVPTSYGQGPRCQKICIDGQQCNRIANHSGVCQSELQMYYSSSPLREEASVDVHEMSTPSTIAPLWQIDSDLLMLLESLDTCPDDLRPELEQKIAVYVAAEAVKVERCNAVYSALTATVDTATREIERLQARKKAAERSLERLEGYLIRILENRGGGPLRGNNVTFSLRHSNAVVIMDPESVPEKFKVIKQEITIPKTPIRDAIHAGEFVPGASIVQNVCLVRK